MPPRVTFSQIDFSRARFAEIATGMVDLLYSVSDEMFLDIVQALDEWDTVQRFESYFTDWCTCTIPHHRWSGTLDERVFQSVKGFYLWAKEWGRRGIQYRVEQDGPWKTLRGDEVLGKARAEVLEGFVEQARYRYYQGQLYKTNCEIHLDHRPIRNPHNEKIDLDFAAWSDVEVAGEAISCKCKPSGLTLSHIQDLILLRDTIAQAFNKDCLDMYIVTLHAAHHTHLWLGRRTSHVDPTKVCVVGIENLLALKSLPKPHEHLSA